MLEGVNHIILRHRIKGDGRLRRGLCGESDVMAGDSAVARHIVHRNRNGLTTIRHLRQIGWRYRYRPATLGVNRRRIIFAV